MLFEKITPFCRFSSNQKLSNGLWEDITIAGYDHRIYYITSGFGYIVIDGVKYDLHPNVLILWRSGSSYHYHFNKNSNGQCLSCNFDFTSCSDNISTPIPPDKIEKFNQDKIIEKNIFFKDTPVFNNVIYLENAITLHNLLLSLSETYTKKKKFWHLECNNILQKILLEIFYQSEKVFDKTTATALKIIDYIDAHITNPLTNKEIGRAFSYHPNYLNAIINAYTNMSLHQYVIVKKLHYAIKLLITTNKSISEIASDISMNDPQYFSRIFKKVHKVTPSSFRDNK